MKQAFIRKILPDDNLAIAQIIRKVLVDHKVPKVGTAYEDEALENMFQAYNKSGATYFVIEEEGKLIGGAGIDQLANYNANVCELQKMYFLNEARGRGLGAKMMTVCLEQAKAFGYEKCYLETMPTMKDAQKLYKRFGFEYITTPLGNTGHYSCPVWMLKELH